MSFKYDPKIKKNECRTHSFLRLKTNASPIIAAIGKAFFYKNVPKLN
jgi:hypothetical protein